MLEILVIGLIHATHYLQSGPSPKSPKRSKSGKKTKTPEPEPEPEPEAPPGTPPPEPGSDEWEYVNQPLQQVSH